MSRVAGNLTERWHLNKNKGGEGMSPLGVWRDVPDKAKVEPPYSLSATCLAEWAWSSGRRCVQGAIGVNHLRLYIWGEGMFPQLYLLPLSLSFLCSTILTFQFLKSNKPSHTWFSLSGIFLLSRLAHIQCHLCNKSLSYPHPVLG